MQGIDNWSNFESYKLRRPVGLLRADVHKSPFRESLAEVSCASRTNLSAHEALLLAEFMPAFCVMPVLSHLRAPAPPHALVALVTSLPVLRRILPVPRSLSKMNPNHTTLR